MKTLDSFLNVPNCLSFLRLFSAPLLPVLFFTNEPALFTFVLTVTLLTDFFDGFWARAFDQHTFLGSVIDPAADKILLLGCVVCLGHLEWVPDVFLLTVMMRNIVQVVMFLVYQKLQDSKPKVEPDVFAKSTTCFLYFIFILSFAHELYGFWQPHLSLFGVATCLEFYFMIFYTVKYAFSKYFNSIGQEWS